MSNSKHSIKICLGSACYSKAEHTNLFYIQDFLKENNLESEVEFVGHLCKEQCSKGPNVEIDGVLYNEISVEKLKVILPLCFKDALVK